MKLRRTFFFLFGFIVFGLVLFFAIGDQLVDESWLDSLGSWAWVAAVLLIVADIFLPIPTTMVITMMGNRYGWLAGGLIGTLGSFSAGVIAYGLTRMLGHRFARWLLRDELDRARHFFDHSGSFAVACSRWLPLLPEAISCMAGLARMPFGKYCVALLCGAVPMCFAYSALSQISEDQTLPLIISVIMPVPIWWVAGKLLHRRATERKPDLSDEKN